VRIRSIKPEFWRSDDITSLDLADRLLFIGLWSYVDDNGVGRDSLAHITADLFAADLERDSSETFARVSRGLSKLAERGQIVRYEGEQRTTRRHQAPAARHCQVGEAPAHRQAGACSLHGSH
jgi:hypothetical protein